MSLCHLFALQILKTELVRHIFDAGKLNDLGTEEAARNVVEEGSSCQSVRLLLGKEEERVGVGSVSLNDYQIVHGRRVLTRISPPAAHTGPWAFSEPCISTILLLLRSRCSKCQNENL